ncbi:MAG: hypothetical protein J6T82_08530 [Bacteroidaceae bacterium]|nr:hypothetical protein [Bacteroidaceae bacterium]
MGKSEINLEERPFLKMMVERDRAIAERRLKERRESAKAPYVRELEEIKARAHRDGFKREEDEKRESELLTICEMIDSGEIEPVKSSFDFVGAMKDFAARRIEAEKQRINQNHGIV